MKKEDIFVSVIVPVYNVKAYLERCIRTILDQTNREFELLLVDDGSTDGSGEICEDWAKKDARICVFHKENGGLSDARNYGMKEARGTHFAFVDSDDYVGTDFLRILVEQIAENEVEIASVIRKSIPDSVETEFLPSEDVRETLDVSTAIRHMCMNLGFGVSPCGRLYARRLYDTISFPKGKLYEDLLTSPYVIAQSNGMSYSKSIQYYYVQRENSIMHRSLSERDFSVFDGLDDLVRFVDANYPKEHDAAIWRVVDDSFETIIHRLTKADNYEEKIDWIVERCRPYWKEGLRLSTLGKGKKLQIRLLFANPKLYRKVYGLKN